MEIAKVHFKSQEGSELFFGKWIAEKKDTKETHAQFDARTWRKKIHVDKDDNVYLQPFALKNALESAAKWMSMPIPSEGKKTFTRRFQSGTLVVKRMYLKDWDGKQILLEDVKLKELPVPSDGKRGSGKRVVRAFPYVEEWQLDAEIFVLDEKIDENVMLLHLETVAMFIGFGSMRVENGGINGRSSVESFSLNGQA